MLCADFPRWTEVFITGIMPCLQNLLQIFALSFDCCYFLSDVLGLLHISEFKPKLTHSHKNGNNLKSYTWVLKRVSEVTSSVCSQQIDFCPPVRGIVSIHPIMSIVL